MSEALPEEARRNLFRTLVDMQDQGSSVEESRRQVAMEFGTAIEDICDIEREGIANQWPPLSPTGN